VEAGAAARSPAVFFGADPRPIAVGQLRAHREKLREYTELEQALSGSQAAGPLTTLRAGIGHEREWIRYWADLAAGDDDRTSLGRRPSHPRAAFIIFRYLWDFGNVMYL
jgi:hypothetical protein